MSDRYDTMELEQKLSGGDECSYKCILLNEFLWNRLLRQSISEEILRAEHAYVNIHTPIIILATALYLTYL